MLDRHAIHRSLDVFVRCAGADDGDLVEELVRAGFSETEAAKLIVFVPLAFGRAVLEVIEPGLAEPPRGRAYSLSPTFCVMSKRGDWVERPLSGEPTYVTALAVAQEAPRTGAIERDDVLKIASRSWELQAVSRMLREGQSVAGSTFVATQVTGLSSEDLNDD